MKPRHAALAVLTTTIWGVNFVVIKVGLHEFPPLLFSALRFLAAAVPALWFVGRPRVAWRWVFAVALALGVAKFGLLFLGMERGMPAGLSSLVLQSQVIFTVLFATAVLRERPRPVQLVGMAVAGTGIVLIALDHGVGSPLSALLLVVLAAVAWGVSNVVTRYAKPPDALNFIVWVSAAATLPLLALSVIFEGPPAIFAALGGLSWSGVGALLFVAWISTLFGFGAWGFLLREHDASTVVPFALLVPVAGMFSGWLFLDEPVPLTRLAAAVLVVVGMAATTVHRPAATPGIVIDAPTGVR
ncbi:EamA family transporter [Saccharothrix obliqua]|uniref:EamA family transporter n=1 Tax=Saccharothrix obliqua TaxID=2861747 RepID=UPI001C5D8C05|nr:EamA family transporter [Saccharothrix obliqua]MBW4720239.1 EamA family transporter [Saccharothrix obliqua]